MKHRAGLKLIRSENIVPGSEAKRKSVVLEPGALGDSGEESVGKKVKVENVQRR